MKKLFKSVLLVFLFSFLILGFSRLDWQVEAKEAKFIDIITGTGKNLGDEVAIGDEHFYILSYDGEEIRMLAKYGLDIDVECVPLMAMGNTRESFPEVTCKIRPTSTGLQSSKVSGITNHGEAIVGTPYATYKKYGKYPSSYQGSMAEEYVNKYVELLKKKYNANVTGDLVNAMDLNIIEREMPVETKVQVDYEPNTDWIPKKVKWFFDLTYWTKVAYDYEFVAEVNSEGYIDEYYVGNVTAIRPVIVVSVDNLKGESSKEICKDNICFTDNDGDGKVSMSDKICVDKECFYVLQNTGYEVKMLARYNLEIGSKCISDYDYSPYPQSTAFSIDGPRSVCSVIAQATRLQDIKAKGLYGELGYDMETYGVTEYANRVVSGNTCSSYKGSLAQGYVDNYVKYLKSISNIDYKGTLLKLDDIEDAIGDELISYDREKNLMTKEKEMPSLSIKRFENNKSAGYDFLDLYSNEKIPGWLYSRTYWTRTSLSEDYLVAVLFAGVAVPMDCEENDIAGIRPLITIPLEAVPTSDKNIDISACYECDGELVWTDKPGKSCKKDETITNKGMCVNNPKTGVRSFIIISLIVALLMSLGYVLYRRYNRFGRI